MQQCTTDPFIQTGEASITIRRYTVDWIANKTIVGISWLHEDGPKLDWRSNSMKLDIRDRSITLEAECSEYEDSIQEHNMTGKQIARLERGRSCKAAHVLVRPLQGECNYQNEHPKEIKIILNYHNDVPSEELRGELSSARNFGMTIDLQRVTKPKIGLVHKLSKQELKELKLQLETTL